MMQLIGHFENSFSLVVVYVVTNCDKPESRAINAFVHFFSFRMSTQALYLSYIVFPLNCYFLRFISCYERV